MKQNTLKISDDTKKRIKKLLSDVSQELYIEMGLINCKFMKVSIDIRVKESMPEIGIKYDLTKVEEFQEIYDEKAND